MAFLHWYAQFDSEQSNLQHKFATLWEEKSTESGISVWCKSHIDWSMQAERLPPLCYFTLLDEWWRMSPEGKKKEISLNISFIIH